MGEGVGAWCTGQGVGAALTARTGRWDPPQFQQKGAWRFPQLLSISTPPILWPGRRVGWQCQPGPFDDSRDPPSGRRSRSGRRSSWPHQACARGPLGLSWVGWGGVNVCRCAILLASDARGGSAGHTAQAGGVRGRGRGGGAEARAARVGRGGWRRLTAAPRAPPQPRGDCSGLYQPPPAARQARRPAGAPATESTAASAPAPPVIPFTRTTRSSVVEHTAAVALGAAGGGRQGGRAAAVAGCSTQTPRKGRGPGCAAPCDQQATGAPAPGSKSSKYHRPRRRKAPKAPEARSPRLQHLLHRLWAAHDADGVDALAAGPGGGLGRGRHGSGSRDAWRTLHNSYGDKASAPAPALTPAAPIRSSVRAPRAAPSPGPPLQPPPAAPRCSPLTPRCGPLPRPPAAAP
jgi:hypothetical protein